MLTAGEFYNYYLKDSEEGQLKSSLLDDFTICALGLTPDDLKPLMLGHNHDSKSWYDILGNLLEKKDVVERAFSAEVYEREVVPYLDNPIYDQASAQYDKKEWLKLILGVAKAQAEKEKVSV